MLIFAIGASDANSYVSLQDADIYFAARGNSDWSSLTEAEKTIALIKATDYLEATYYSAWKGRRTRGDQALSWPRYDVSVDGFRLESNKIPIQVKKACYEMAVRSTERQLIEDQDQRVVEEKVDVLTVKYYEHSDPSTRYVFVNRILDPLLRSASDGDFQSVRLTRA